MPLLEPNTGFSRLIVSLIAITALCTALCGWGYSLAASKAGEAAHQALEQGVEMHIRSSRLNAVTNQMLLQLFNIQEYTARLLAAFEGARHLKTYKDDSVDRIKAYRAILAKYQPWIDRGFMEDPTFGMQADKNFPDKLKYNWMKPEVLQEQAFARWDACSQRSLTWQALARIFLGILTVLAMAIYLFGQAHGMGEGPWAERLIFYGLLLLLIAVACSLVTLWPGSSNQGGGGGR